MAARDVPTPFAVHVASGNGFVHGVPLTPQDEPPTMLCHTNWPSLWCTCGACVLTWGYEPGSMPAGTRLTAFAKTRVFVHAQSPSDGSGVQCTTVRGERVCACGQYALEWEPLEDDDGG